MRFSLFLILFTTSGFSYAIELVDSIVDPNYALCEGVGVHASGTVNIYADYEKFSNNTLIKHLNIVGLYQTSPQLSGKVIYTDESDKHQEVVLQEPWYPVITRAGSKSLTNPQIRTTGKPGVDDKMVLNVMKDSELTISLTVIHTSNVGNCPTSFSHTFKL